jgi:hypothetical protein
MRKIAQYFESIQKTPKRIFYKKAQKDIKSTVNVEGDEYVYQGESHYEDFAITYDFRITKDDIFDSEEAEHLEARSPELKFYYNNEVFHNGDTFALYGKLEKELLEQFKAANVQERKNAVKKYGDGIIDISWPQLPYQVMEDIEVTKEYKIAIEGAPIEQIALAIDKTFPPEERETIIEAAKRGYYDAIKKFDPSWPEYKGTIIEAAKRGYYNAIERLDPSWPEYKGTIIEA